MLKIIGSVKAMKPSDRFTKKVWRKPPKNQSKQHKMSNKTGKGKCAICKEPMTSSKRKLARRNYNPAKSSTRTNRPYGGYICNKCLKQQTIEQTQQLVATEK